VSLTHQAQRLQRKFLAQLRHHSQQLLLERARFFFHDLDDLFFFLVLENARAYTFEFIVESVSFSLFPTREARAVTVLRSTAKMSAI